MIEIEAAPEPFNLDPAKAALLVIDMQNDFGARGGMFDRAGIDISGIQAAIAPTAKAIAAAREAGIRIIFVKMAFRPDLSDAGPADAPNRRKHARLGVREGGRTLIRDTWNTEIVDSLKPQPTDPVVYKHRFSAFFETELDGLLKQLGVRSLIVTGCTTSVCVESTIRDAMFRDYSCLLLEDCTAEPVGNHFPGSNHEASVRIIQALFGWVASSDRFIQALNKRPSGALAGTL